MGPVSFESLDAGSTRARALQLAGLLGESGIGVMSIVADQHGGESRFRLIVRSDDATRARELLGSVDT